MGSSQSKGGSSNGSSQGSSQGSTANTTANVDVTAFREKQDEKYGKMGTTCSSTTVTNAPGKGTIFEGKAKQMEPPFVTVKEMAKSGNLQEGDPIEFEDSVMRHWAIYAGQQEATATEPAIPVVVHFFSLDGQPHTVRYDALSTAADGKRCRINKKYDQVLEPRSPEDILRKAHSMLGKKDYNIISNNCEHFVTGCRYGFFVSEQVQEAHNSFGKQMEIVGHVVKNGFSTATYNLKGLFSSK